MNFEQLVLRDFGLYAGEQTLTLTAESGRPVVLIGGTNGAGKTTLLEAITLCLHGRRALGARVSIEQYHRYLRSRIHVSPTQGQAKSAAVAMTFTRIEGRATVRYVVTRSWRRSDRADRITEELTVRRDGEEILDLPHDTYQDFLDGLLPPGVAGLFLFDGEKIQAIAEDETGEQLADAIRRLLGLDLVAQLRSDLRRYAASEPGADKDLADELAQAEDELERYAQDAKALADRRATLQARADLFANKAEQARQRFIAEGGTLAQSRGALQDAARAAAVKRASVEEDVRQLVHGLLPFALAPDLARRVSARLVQEKKASEDEIVAERLDAALEKIRAQLKQQDGRGVAALRRALGVAKSQRQARVHDLTAHQVGVALEQLRLLIEVVPSQVHAARTALRTAIDEDERAQSVLANVPDDAAVAQQLRELNALERELGAIEAELCRIDEEAMALEQEKRIVERQADRIHERLAKTRGFSERSRVALKTATVLEQFARQSEQAKLSEIELETARLYNRLSRKGAFLSEVKIDPERFTVSLTRWDGSTLPKVRLSAGEKQLFAISVLWALAKTARRAVPVVVDTPLARLDTEHRGRLLTEYFPHVSHQVIVLSTDTEVDARAASLLEEFLTRRIMLEHDPTAATTAVVDGYFGVEEVDARAGA